MKEAEPHNMGFYLFIRRDFGHLLPYFPLRENWARESQILPLYPDFCIALLGIAPRFSQDVPLNNHNKAMSHEEAEPHNMGFYLFIRKGLWTPFALFSSRENWARVSGPSIPRFLHSLVGDRPEILSGRPP